MQTEKKLNFNKKLEIQIITLSDRASKGEYTDLSGPEIENTIIKYFNEKGLKYRTKIALIPDDPEQLEILLLNAKENKVDILFTTGGTGVGSRDFTPDIAKRLMDKEIPGIMENIRIKCAQQNPNALLSRSIAGIMGQTQVYCLPGSLNAVKDYMSEILKTLEHLIFMLHNVDIHKTF